MKRRVLIGHLESNGCVLLREGGKHSLYINPANSQTSAIPRHREINDCLARKICRDPGHTWRLKSLEESGRVSPAPDPFRASIQDESWQVRWSRC